MQNDSDKPDMREGEGGHPGAPSALGERAPSARPEEAPLTEIERRVMDQMSDEWAWHTATVAAEAGLTKAETLVAQRGLASKGLARFQRGLLDEDGTAAGSGYFLTRAAMYWRGPADGALGRHDYADEPNDMPKDSAMTDAARGEK